MQFDEYLRIIHILPTVDPAGYLIPENSNIRLVLPQK